MHAGTGSFCGIFKPATAVENPRFALIGAPYDAGSTFRPGARGGPEHIRAMARSLSPASERGHDLSSLPAVDLGDLALPTRIDEVEARIEDAVGQVVDGGTVPIVLGGDHGITVPSFAAVQARHENLHLLVLDAHPDLYPDFEGDPYAHACVSHRILQLPDMDGSRMTHAGIRAATPAQIEAASKAGVTTVGPWEVERFRYRPHDPTSTPVYLSIDIDVLDPAHAPGCGNPVPGGLSTRQLLDLIHDLATVDIVAVDVVEVNPLLDPQGITALAAVRVVTEVLATMVEPAG